jgi:death-on-curing protein
VTPARRPRFLALDEVLGLHERQIALYGGAAGLRDLGLLQSAVAVPQATFGGVWLHASLEEMAAAYLFHLAQNHPFVDGNKRTAAIATVVFLHVNGLLPTFTEDELVDLTLGVAAGRVAKAEAAVAVAAHVRPIGAKRAMRRRV